MHSFSGLLWIYQMLEEINESVSVFLLSSPSSHPRPWSMTWRGRIYRFIKTSLYYQTKTGKTIWHIFTVNTSGAWFKLALNAETLFWKLLETESYDSEL